MSDKTYTIVILGPCDYPQFTVYKQARNADISQQPGGLSRFTSSEGKIVQTNAPLIVEEE